MSTRVASSPASSHNAGSRNSPVVGRAADLTPPSATSGFGTNSVLLAKGLRARSLAAFVARTQDVRVRHSPEAVGRSRPRRLRRFPARPAALPARERRDRHPQDLEVRRDVDGARVARRMLRRRAERLPALIGADRVAVRAGTEASSPRMTVGLSRTSSTTVSQSGTFALPGESTTCSRGGQRPHVANHPRQGVGTARAQSARVVSCVSARSAQV